MSESDMAKSWTELTQKWQQTMMGNWGQATRDMVASPDFAAASSASLDASLSWQKQIREQSGQYMESLDLPKRSDLARLAKQVGGLQARLLEVEDKLDATLDLLRQIRSVQPVEAEASEAAPAKKEAPRKKAGKEKKSPTRRKKG